MIEEWKFEELVEEVNNLHTITKDLIKINQKLTRLILDMEEEFEKRIKSLEDYTPVVDSLVNHVEENFQVEKFKEEFKDWEDNQDD